MRDPAVPIEEIDDSSLCRFLDADNCVARASHLLLYSSAFTCAIFKSSVFSDSSANKSSEADVDSDSASSCMRHGIRLSQRNFIQAVH